MTEPKPKTPRPLDGLNRIGKYEVLTDTVGAGGFCCVYPCQYNSPSTARVAIKVSLLSVEDCENDIKWTAHKREWQIYQSMAFGRSQASQRSGIPAVYECGFVQTSKGVHSWMSMQLLGPDLRKLAYKNPKEPPKVTATETHFIPYATGMLAALQHVHQHGIVHNDVKPANFCLATGDIQATSKVYIVDFGLATVAPDREQASQNSYYMHTNFQGTPDYASTDALNGLRCSAKDDLESLGYAFLEMLTGDLPWDLATDVEYDESKYFSYEQLCGMACTRDKLWETSCKDGKIPTFLVNWQRYVRSLKAFDTPSYAWLFRLIQRAQDKPAAQLPTKRSRESAVTIQSRNCAAEEEHTTPSAKHPKIAEFVATEE